MIRSLEQIYLFSLPIKEHQSASTTDVRVSRRAREARKRVAAPSLYSCTRAPGRRCFV
jgi:hypothetical protein